MASGKAVTTATLAKGYARIGITQAIISIVLLVVSILTSWDAFQGTEVAFLNPLQVVVAAIGLIAAWMFISLWLRFRSLVLDQTMAQNGINEIHYIPEGTRTCEGAPVLWFHVLGSVMILLKALWYIVEIVSFCVLIGEANAVIIGPVVGFLLYAAYAVLCVILGRQLRALIHAGAEMSQKKASAAQPQMAMV